jgi:hypothetical protein
MRILFLLLMQWMTSVQAMPTPTPSIGPPADTLFHFTVKSGEDAPTYRMIDAQNKIMDSGSRNIVSTQDSLVSGHARAQEMVDLLKGQELQHAFGGVNEKGKQMLQENPEMKNPIAIVAGAVSLWVGRTVKLIKDEKFKLATRLEARSRTGEFSMESPILNGKLSFTGGSGFNMNVTREINPVNLRAEMNYSQHDQNITGQFVHPITPNLGVVFGATQWQQNNQTDGRASVQYNLSF